MRAVDIVEIAVNKMAIMTVLRVNGVNMADVRVLVQPLVIWLMCVQ